MFVCLFLLLLARLHSNYPIFIPTHQIINHYAPAAAKHEQPARSLFITSLGPCIQLTGRDHRAFYNDPKGNPHPKKLGYHLMADMVAHHIKVGSGWNGVC